MTSRFNKLRLKTDGNGKGIVYVGHLPRGFAEKEIKGFFSQFGEISKMRISRSKKTGRSKGYGFIEFAEKDVAEIATKAMNGYMMFHKTIECHMVELPHRDTFKHGNRDWKFIPT